MRSLSALMSVIGTMPHAALPQSVAQRDASVKDKAFATPLALRLGHAFQIFQNAAFEVIDLRKAARQQIARGFFATDAAGAEHRDLAVLRRIEMARGKILELSE